MNIEFTGKTAIVTGAAHGIGRAIVHQLAATGAHVWACDILPDVLRKTVDSAVPQNGGSVYASVTDVSDAEAVTALVEKASASSGRVDILVHVAGGTIGQVGQPLEDVTMDQWQAIFRCKPEGRFYLLSGRRPGNEAGRLRQNPHHLQRRRSRRQPYRHPGLRLSQGRTNRPRQTARPRTRPLRHHRQQRRARLHPFQPHQRKAVARHGC